MKWILIFCLNCNYSVQVVEFESLALCEQAEEKLRDLRNNFRGVCVQKRMDKFFGVGADK